MEKSNNSVQICDICNIPIRKNQKGICVKCKQSLHKATEIPKRIINIESKFLDIKQILEQYNNSSQATIQLDIFFSTKEKIFLEVLTKRYYEHKTLDELGKTLWSKSVTREYVRQCEDKAIDIIKRKTGTALNLDSKSTDEIDNIFNSKL